MGIDWRHGLRLDSRVRAYAWPVFLVSLVVDLALAVLFRDYTSSAGAAQLLEPALTIAVLGVALFAGPLFGLTAALFLGTVFYCFLASLPGPSEIGFTLGAIALWSGAAVALGVLADRRRGRTEEIERTLGRKVVIPLPVSSAVELRAALRALLRSHEMDEGQGEMVVLATQEAYNNAVVHPPGVVEVSAQVFEQVVDVEVRDKGPGFEPAAVVTDGETGAARRPRQGPLSDTPAHGPRRHRLRPSGHHGEDEQAARPPGRWGAAIRSLALATARPTALARTHGVRGRMAWGVSRPNAATTHGALVDLSGQLSNLHPEVRRLFE